MATMFVTVGGKQEQRLISHVEKDRNGRWQSVPHLAPGEEMHRTTTGVVITKRAVLVSSTILTGLEVLPGMEHGPEYWAYYSDGSKEKVTQLVFETLREIQEGRK